MDGFAEVVIKENVEGWDQIAIHLTGGMNDVVIYVMLNRRRTGRTVTIEAGGVCLSNLRSETRFLVRHAAFTGKGWLTDLTDHVIRLHDCLTHNYFPIMEELFPEPEPEAHPYKVLFASYCEEEGFSSQTSADQKYTWFTIELVMPEWTEQIRLVNRNSYTLGEWTALVRVAWDVSIDDVSVHVKVRPLSEYCLDPYHLTPKRCGLYAEQLHLAGCMGSQIQAYIDTRKSQ